jgi:alpha-D-ribose 1-methylphosphonate 5-triphosphate diphosphatase
MGQSLLLENARVVTRREVFLGGLKADNGVISDLYTQNGGAPGALDLEGDYLIPGLVELHTDNLEKHFVPRPGVRWNPLSAAISHDAQVAAAGITTVFDALSLSDAPDKPQRKDALIPMWSGLKGAQEAGILKSRHLLHLRCDITNPIVMELFEPFKDEPCLALMSLTDHTPGVRQYRDLERFKKERTKRYDYNLEKLDAYINERQERSKTLGPVNQAKLTKLAKELHLPLASHDDASKEHVQEALAQGIKVSEFPVTLEAARACNELGLKCMAGAPNLVRGGSHCHNLSMAEAAEYGLVDVVSSDYIPMSLIQAVFKLHQAHKYDLPRAVATASLEPAKAADLKDRGELTPGKLADLVRVGMYGEFPVVKAVWREGRQIA